MNQNTKVKIKLNGLNYEVVDLADRKIKSFELTDNLDEALYLLRKINSLKLKNGEPIYKLRMIHGFSTWSFHQGQLYWGHLRHFVFYRPLIQYLTSNNYDVELTGEEGPELNTILMFCGLIGRGDIGVRLSWSRIGVLFINLALGLIAKIIGYITLVSKLVGGDKVLIYSPDKFDIVSGSDFRMKEIYQFLNNHHIPFVEIFHTLLGKDFLSNLFSRKRVGFYLEYLPIASHSSILIRKKSIFDPSIFDGTEKTYISNLVTLFDKYCKISVKRVKTVRRVAKLTRLKKLITIDDLRSQEVIAAMKSLDRETYAFQHGHINKYHCGHMYYGIPANMVASFDKLFVWNEYWKKMLVKNSEVYNELNVEVGGELRPLKYIQFKRKKIPEEYGEISLLIVNDTWAPREEVRFYLNRLIDMGCTLYLSMRPDLSAEKQLKDYGLEASAKIRTSSGISQELLESIDGVAGMYSTFIREILFYGLPAFAFQTEFKFGYDLVEDDLAHPLKKNFTLEEMQVYLKIADDKKEIIWPNPGTSVEEKMSIILQKYVK